MVSPHTYFTSEWTQRERVLAGLTWFHHPERAINDSGYIIWTDHQLINKVLQVCSYIRRIRRDRPAPVEQILGESFSAAEIANIDHFYLAAQMAIVDGEKSAISDCWWWDMVVSPVKNWAFHGGTFAEARKYDTRQYNNFDVPGVRFGGACARMAKAEGWENEGWNSDTFHKQRVGRTKDGAPIGY